LRDDFQDKPEFLLGVNERKFEQNEIKCIDLKFEAKTGPTI